MARDEGPLTIAVINMKGGVGKSTITALLCRHAAINRKLDVLAVDLDPQANLSQAFMGSAYTTFLRDQRPSIVELFNGYQPPTNVAGSVSQLSDVSVSASRLGSISLRVIPSRFDFSDNLINAVRPDPHILARYLSEHFRHKDLIFIDCAPTESVLTRAAYHASRLILVPVKPEYFATIGFPLLQESLETFRKANRGHRIDVSGVVINNGFYNGGNNGGPEKWQAMKEIREEAAKNEWIIFRNEIPYSRGFPKIMRGNYSYSGNAWSGFYEFANEYLNSVGLTSSEAT
jgi:chromosome partitioning protein